MTAPKAPRSHKKIEPVVNLPGTAYTQATLQQKLRRLADVQFSGAANLSREAADRLDLYEGFLVGLLHTAERDGGLHVEGSWATKTLDHLGLAHAT